MAFDMYRQTSPTTRHMICASTQEMAMSLLHFQPQDAETFTELPVSKV